ncbi:MAG: hypothetical protein NTZ40_13165 [Cyanobacteria bacterium]|nr:hypothetical protein [Cyanobacteriota bacterium]
MSHQHQPRLLRLVNVYCAWTIHRSHAKSGDRARISGYLGEGEMGLRRLLKTAVRD